ncbi:MAG: response regulator transcription factor [Acidobacteria bacterium]|nr:response regulator transcription factor [Acidobacteriota bacterium]
MKPMRVALAEDEPLARERLTLQLRAAGCEVVACLCDGPSLLAWLEEAPPLDALFLDIQMPGASSFEVIGELAGRVNLPPLVFVTAHPEHALHAFEVEARDYLLKPVTAARLNQTLERLGRGESRPRDESESRGTSGLRFPARAGQGHVILDFRKVTHFEMEKEIVYAWVQGSRFRTPWRRLSEVETSFPKASLIRIQRHILLRPEVVLAVRPLFGGRLLARVGDGLDLEVSRGASQRLKDLLGL